MFTARCLVITKTEADIREKLPSTYFLTFCCRSRRKRAILARVAFDIAGWCFNPFSSSPLHSPAHGELDCDPPAFSLCSGPELMTGDGLSRGEGHTIGAGGATSVRRLIPNENRNRRRKSASYNKKRLCAQAILTEYWIGRLLIGIPLHILYCFFCCMASREKNDWSTILHYSGSTVLWAYV